MTQSVRHLIRRFFVFAAFFAVTVAPAWAEGTRLYVYELTDGSRIVTDHALNAKHYRLVRTGEAAKGMGQLAAARTPEFFRPDSSAYDASILAKAKEHQMDFPLIQ